ncbi:MAG: hypothetical protein JRN52_11035 [Nitrososphaerota archaeon]|nr:hypothetical protein [Nitrososphaerota archaeon]
MSRESDKERIYFERAIVVARSIEKLPVHARMSDGSYGEVAIVKIGEVTVEERWTRKGRP